MSAAAPKLDSAGAKSVVSNDMQELTEGKEEISNVIRGHKANLANPSMSCLLSCVQILDLAMPRS